MFIGRGVVIGTKNLINSSYFFLVIIRFNFNINSLRNLNITKRQNTTMEEITTTAIKLGELAKNFEKSLKNKLLKS